MTFLATLGIADKHPHDDHAHHPTPSPVYTYYAPYPTTPTTTTTTTTTTTLPYIHHYDTFNAPTEVYESGGLYYYYYPNENEVDYYTTDEPLETTTVISEVEDECTGFLGCGFGPLQKLFIILFGISLGFPSRLAVSVRKKRGLFFHYLGFEPRSLEFFDLAETGFFAPDLLDYFYSMKDGFLNDISEDKDTCIQRLFCEFLSHEDPYVQNMASKW